MITIEKLTEIVEQQFEIYFAVNPKKKSMKMDSRYMTYYVALEHGIRNRDLARHFDTHHTTILYGKDKISDLLSYDKAIKHLLNGIKTEIESLKIAENES